MAALIRRLQADVPPFYGPGVHTLQENSPPEAQLLRKTKHQTINSDFERSSFDTLFQRYYNIKPGLLPVQRRLMSVYLIYPQFAYTFSIVFRGATVLGPYMPIRHDCRYTSSPSQTDPPAPSL